MQNLRASPLGVKYSLLHPTLISNSYALDLAHPTNAPQPLASAYGSHLYLRGPLRIVINPSIQIGSRMRRPTNDEEDPRIRSAEKGIM